MNASGCVSGYTPGDIKRSLPAASVAQDTEMTADDNAAPPQEEPMQDQLKTWTDKFEAIESATAKAIDKAEAIMRKLIGSGADQKRLEERGRQLVKTLEAGKMPKESTTLAERNGPPRQQTLGAEFISADPEAAILQLRERQRQLLGELEGVDAKRAELEKITRTLAVWDGKADR